VRFRAFLPWSFGFLLHLFNTDYFFFGKSMTTPTPIVESPAAAKSDPSFVKLAMRNMVRKGGKSLYHFALSSIGLIGLFVGLAYLTR
jgi:Protein of unknown function (DUF3285)